MKNKLIILFASAVCLTGCKDFLDVKPVGARFTTELDAVRSVMASWMYNFEANGKMGTSEDGPSPWIPRQFSSQSSFYSAVDVWSFSAWDMRAGSLSADEKRRIDRGILREDWMYYYDLIGLMNLIIIEAQTASGDEELRDILLGEAHIQRAYYFFKLLQYYTPVDDPTKGIPMHLGIYEGLDEADLSPKSQSTVYAQIISDLENAEKIIARTDPTSFNIMFGKDWIYRIASQIYLWKASTAAGESEDWAQAAKYAELALKQPSGGGPITLPYDHDDLRSSILGSGVYGFSLGAGYPETLAIGGGMSSYLPNSWTYDIDVWKTLYEDGDKRKTNWFLLAEDHEKPSGDILESSLNVTRKFPGGGLWGDISTIFLFRLAEQWLIRTEALAMSGDIAGAQEALTTWRSLRYEEGTVLPMPATAEDIRHEVYLERKREFLGEGDLLWLDMKRFGVTETRRVQDFTATLEANDFRYQFDIPEEELKYNPNIVANPGWAGLEY